MIGGLIASLHQCAHPRQSLLVGCSLAVMAAAAASAAAQSAPTSRSPSAADFDTPEYRADWGLAQINAATAYARGFTGLGITVAVYDSGIDRNHPEFAGRISPDSRNFFYASDRTFYPAFIRDERGHGTHVSGTIAAARDGTGTMGVAYDGTILSLYGIPSYGVTQGGRVADFRVDYAGALAYAAQRGARVYNGSYGEDYSRSNAQILQKQVLSYEYVLSEYNSIKRAVDTGTLFVFAAMNNYGTQPIISENPTSTALLPYIKPSNASSGIYQFYDIYRFNGDPIGHPIDQSQIDFSGVAGSIVAVVATDRDNTIASFSNRCGVTASWCIAAPGVDILSTTPTDMGQPYNYMSGTSMATPHVSGAAAVLMQAFPFLTAPQIAQTMFSTATHLGDGPADTPNATYGWGLLNLGKAIDGPGQFTTTWKVDTTYKGQAYDARFANDISGPGGLIKTGLGTLELAGTNTYAGGTAITGGILAVSRDTNLGAAGTGLDLGGGTLRILADGFSTARPITLDSIGGLRIDGGTATFSGVIADGAQAGSLVKTGAGAALLSAANTFTGRTVVSDGALILTATGRLVSPVFVAEGARFINVGLASGGVQSVGTLVNGGTVLGGVINAGTLTSRGTITGSLANAGLAFNDGAITGGTNNTGGLINGGTISGGLTNAGSVQNEGTITGGATNAGILSNRGTILGAVSNGGTLATSGTIVGSLANAGTAFNGGAILGGVTSVGSLITSGMITGGVANAGSLANGGTISGGLTNAGSALNDGLIIGGVANTGTLATTGTIAGGLTNRGTVLASGILAGLVNNAQGAILALTGPITGITRLTDDGTLVLGSSALTIGSLAGQGRVVLGAARLIAGLDGSSTTFAGTLEGTGGLTKAGSGTLTLTGASTYTGTTTIAAGTLQLGDGGTGGSLVGDIANAATLAFNRADDLTYAGTVSGTGTLTKLGGGTLTLTAAHSFTGLATLAAGGLNLTATASLAAPLVTRPGTTLVNAGIVTGGLSNAGLVQNRGTIAGRVANAGFLGNGGTISGAATNDSTGFLVNVGTLAGGVTNAGLLGNTGTIDGGLSNTGLTQNGGLITGGATNAGTLASTGTIAGGLSNAGTAQNGGTVTGGVVNAGTLATSGTLAGGLTNTGSVTASAGRIDGAIANNAGTLAVSGTVASDGSFANAAGATLAVAGTYSLNRPLTNAGTVTVAQNASLTAPAGLGNTGLLASDGILTTDLTNTGAARLSGQLNGALTNAGFLQVIGPLAGLTSLTNAGPLDLGGTALTLANLTGPASGVIGNGQITVTGSASMTYAGAILQSTSPTSLTKAGSGTLKLTGTGRFSGPTTIQAGTLSLDGVWASPVTVAAAGTLRGIGTVAAPITVAGALRPGNSPGTLTVLGPVAFASGSLLGLDIDGTGTGTGAGSYARLLALGPTGAVAANGTLVPMLRGITGNASNAYTPALGQRFGVLVAQAGLSGSFTGLGQPTVGLPAGTRFDALYRPSGLDLVVTPSAYGNLAGLGLAQTGNAQAVGAALDVARPAAGTRPDAERARVFDALYAAGPATLPAGLASLSGQAYGDAVMAELAARRLVTDTIDRHLRGQGGGAAAFSAGDPGLGPNRSALQLRGAAGAPDQPLASGEGRVWGDALYGFGSRAGDRAAAGASLDAGGLLLGVDGQVGADTLVGGAFSYLRETGASRGQGFGLGRTTADNYGGTLYASTRLGAVILRGTAGLSHTDGRIDRIVALGAGVSRASGLASGWDAGVSGFVGYALGLGLPVELVPEVGFSYDRLTRARVAERGGLASQSFATAGLDGARALVGGRLASLAVEGTAGLRLEGRAYWAHELGNTFATVRSSLFGVPFSTRTSALSRDGAVLGVSLTGAVAEGVQLSLSYTGDVRPGASAQIVSAGLQARW